jgi:hypothetical protein
MLMFLNLDICPFYMWHENWKKKLLNGKFITLQKTIEMNNSWDRERKLF